jgi:hypothetical protein
MRMRVPTRIAVAVGMAALIVLPLALSGGQSGAQSRSSSTTRVVRPAPSKPGRIVQIWGVGGVLTQDGTLWQYRPEARRWVTIDQSFALDNEKRSVLPLPVSASEVALMQGFGFLVTRSGEAWIYDLDENRWQNVGRPGA